MNQLSSQASAQKQIKSLQQGNLELSMYKVARYVNVILKNCQKIDQAKSMIFNEDFDLNQIFRILDFKNKGFVDEYDFKKLVADNGADASVIKFDRIMRYFASGKKIYKQELLTALVLPPWKLKGGSRNSCPSKNKQDNTKKLLFKLIIAIYLALEQDDSERIKMKQVNYQQVFYGLTNNQDYLRIDQISYFLHSKKFAIPDAFNLLRFMHNRFQVNLQEFQAILRNSLPQRFQVTDLQAEESCKKMACSTSRKFFEESVKKKLKKSQSIVSQTSDLIKIGKNEGLMPNIIEGNLPEFCSNQFQIINCSQNGKVDAKTILNYKISAIFDRKSNIFDKSADIDIVSLLNCQQSCELIDNKKNQIQRREQQKTSQITEEQQFDAMKQKNTFVDKKLSLNMKKVSLTRKDPETLKKENNPIRKLLKR